MRGILYVFFGALCLFAFFFISRFLGGGGEAIPSAVVATASAGVVTSSTRFWVLFVLGAVVLAVWATVNYVSYPKNTPRAERLRGTLPPVWAFAILLGVTTFHWLYWAESPENWSAWLRSVTFWPMNVAIVLAAFFSSQRGSAARYARLALWTLLIVAIGIGAYGKWQEWHEKWQVKAAAKEAAERVAEKARIATGDTTFMVVITPDEPAEVLESPNWRIVWWGDKSRFETRAIWRGRDKIRIFTVRPGVKSVEIKIHRYYDPFPAPK